MTKSILIDQLRSRGLFINEKLLEVCTVNDLSVELLWERGLNSDLRVVGVEALPKDLHSVYSLAEQRICLQIISVSNIAQPSAKQTIPGLYPRLLQLRLTDGIQKVVALEVSAIPKLSVTTPPGTKILIKSPHVRNGKLLLSEENAEVIGGQVHELYTSWKANKDLKEKKRVSGSDKADPPPLFTDFVATTSNNIARLNTKPCSESSKAISSKFKNKENMKIESTSVQKEQVSHNSDTPRLKNLTQRSNEDKKVKTNDKAGASKSIKGKSTLRVTKEFVPKISSQLATEKIASPASVTQESVEKIKQRNIGSKNAKSKRKAKDYTLADSVKTLSDKPTSANKEGKNISREQKPGDDRIKSKAGNGVVREIGRGRGSGRGRGGDGGRFRGCGGRCRGQ